jgi:hypothetical protein
LIGRAHAASGHAALDHTCIEVLRRRPGAMIARVNQSLDEERNSVTAFGMELDGLSGRSLRVANVDPPRAARRVQNSARIRPLLKRTGLDQDCC